MRSKAPSIPRGGSPRPGRPRRPIPLRVWRCAGTKAAGVGLANLQPPPIGSPSGPLRSRRLFEDAALRWAADSDLLTVRLALKSHPLRPEGPDLRGAGHPTGDASGIRQQPPHLLGGLVEAPTAVHIEHRPLSAVGKRAVNGYGQCDP